MATPTQWIGNLWETSKDSCPNDPLLCNHASQAKKVSDAAVAVIVRVSDPTGVLTGRYFTSLQEMTEAVHDDCKIEILYMKRTANANDPWSGHVAFPGGRQDPNESLVHTAKRETFEELGLVLETPWFQYITYLTPHDITRGQRLSGAHVYPFIFLQLWVPDLDMITKYPPEFTLALETTEVAAAIWVPVSHLNTEPDAEIVRRKANNLPVIQRVPWVLLWTLRIEDVCFPSITFPCEQKLQPDGSMQFAENENTSTGAMSPSGQPLFCLWGITLGITSDLCMLVKQHERRWINWPPLTFNSKAVIPNGILKGIYGFIEIYRFPRLRISPANVFLAASICVGIGGLMAFSVKPIKRFVAS